MNNFSFSHLKQDGESFKMHRGQFGVILAKALVVVFLHLNDAFGGHPTFHILTTSHCWNATLPTTALFPDGRKATQKAEQQRSHLAEQYIVNVCIMKAQVAKVGCMLTGKGSC